MSEDKSQNDANGWIDAVVENPSDESLTSGLFGAADALAKWKAHARSGKANRVVTQQQIAKLLPTVSHNADGVVVAHGGTTATKYPATTGVVSAGWYTRTDGVKIVRVLAGFLPILDEAVDPVKIVTAGNTNVGITFVSATLRSMYHYLDIATGDNELDEARKDVHDCPHNRDYWLILAAELAERGDKKTASKIRKRIAGFE